MNRRQLLAAIPALLATSHLSPATIPAAPKKKNPTFQLLEIEGATVLPRGINNHGDISGVLITDNGQTGFVLKADGEVIVITAPGALFTNVSGIDDDGSVAGSYVDTEYGPLKSFLWQNGQFTILVHKTYTVAYGVWQGQVVGVSFDLANPHTRGFIWENGQFTNLDFPGTLGGTFPSGIQDGRIVGSYYGPDGQPRGFIYQNGQFESLSFPASIATGLSDVSSKAILGSVRLDHTTHFQPFVLIRDRFHLLDLPGTNIFGINDAGQIVGDYVFEKGFVADVRAFLPERKKHRIFIDPFRIS